MEKNDPFRVGESGWMKDQRAAGTAQGVHEEQTGGDMVNAMYRLFLFIETFNHSRLSLSRRKVEELKS
ncbi:MAG: hypothetical protein RB296_08400 [Acidobacteriota bacterium]|nr:hypothetical protein [Acidobacteriota bacterium]